MSRGIAVGRVCRFNHNRHSNLPVYKIEGEGVDREAARLKKAIGMAADRLEVIKADVSAKIGAAEAEIFTVQQMILKDVKMLADIDRILRTEQTNAESAVMVVLDSYENRLKLIDDEYIRDKASDFGEVKRRLLDILSNMNPVFQCAELSLCQRGRGRIVVSEELTPGMTMELDAGNILAFVTEHGGINSHAAILARALGIPAVSGVKDIHGIASCGLEMLVNGDTGEVVLAPSDATVADVKLKSSAAIRIPRVMEHVDGFDVMANISYASEINEALDMKADGIGLYRTELEFMAAGRMLDEDEQYARYSAVVKAMAGKPVTFRLFDAGGDKPLPFLEMPKDEENPALGWRGARLLLGNPSLVRTQARAMARASIHGPVNVLYPMIVDLPQFLELRKMFEDAAKDVSKDSVRHGVMFEVPSACIGAAEIFTAADFGSVGTNDLIQYLFVVDRNNDSVAHDYSPDRPVLWQVIGALAAAADKAGKPLSVCGELAGDPRYVGRFIEHGIRSVSVSARLISGARAAAADYFKK